MCQKKKKESWLSLCEEKYKDGEQHKTRKRHSSVRFKYTIIHKGIPVVIQMYTFCCFVVTWHDVPALCIVQKFPNPGGFFSSNEKNIVFLNITMHEHMITYNKHAIIFNKRKK